MVKLIAPVALLDIHVLVTDQLLSPVNEDNILLKLKALVPIAFGDIAVRTHKQPSKFRVHPVLIVMGHNLAVQTVLKDINVQRLKFPCVQEDITVLVDKFLVHLAQLATLVPRYFLVQ